jgi:hypothetical protein
LIYLDDNTLGVWGSNQFGQLGFPLAEQMIPDIKSNPLSLIKNISNFNIIDIECSDNLSYLLLEDKKTQTRKVVRLGIEGKNSYHLNSKDSLDQQVIVSYIM